MNIKGSIDVSIILVTYNTCKMTSECIDSIISHTSGIKYEIILVDNASADGSKEFFEHDPRVRYIYSEKNGGFGYGNNRGMEIARGKYYFLLNTDTLLLNNAIKFFYDYAESHTPKTIYGCYLVDKEGNYACSYFDFPAFTVGQFLKRKFCHKHDNIDYKDKFVPVVCGADMFIPATAISESGMFDENIFMQGEEAELQYRMKKEGYLRKVIHTPKIVHFGGVSSNGSIGPKYLRKTHFYIIHKHMEPFTYLLARFYYKLYDIKSALDIHSR